MVLFLTATLLLSIVGLISLLSIKRWEMNNGVVLVPGVRPKAENFFHAKLYWIEHVLPALIAAGAQHLLALGRWWMHFGIAKSVVWVEQTLERVLHTLRHTTTHMPARGQASAFLREVAEHKRKLLAEVGRQEIKEY